jgi:transposase InsO family protein
MAVSEDLPGNLIRQTATQPARSDGHEAKAGISRWIGFYNNSRPHQALGNRTPMAVWRDGITGALGDKVWT